jgi:hypothetical protein
MSRTSLIPRSSPSMSSRSCATGAEGGQERHLDSAALRGPDGGAVCARLREQVDLDALSAELLAAEEQTVRRPRRRCGCGRRKHLIRR